MSQQWINPEEADAANVLATRVHNSDFQWWQHANFVLSASSSVLVIMVNPHPVKDSSMNARYHKKIQFNIPHIAFGPLTSRGSPLDWLDLLGGV